MADPYARNMFGPNNPYFAKRPVKGKVVVVLDGAYDDRGLALIKPPSRALIAGEIHELIVTDEHKGPGETVNRIAYLAFIEITQGSVIVSGDPVVIGGKQVGKIAGYDETHMPNHLNIVLAGDKVSGKDQGFRLKDDIIIG
ncbi:MAG: hypothetical protein N2491_07055 [Negativicutes bacterium]|nr:hypothetical protein [Negativicutes bacterium]